MVYIILWVRQPANLLVKDNAIHIEIIKIEYIFFLYFRFNTIKSREFRGIDKTRVFLTNLH